MAPASGSMSSDVPRLPGRRALVRHVVDRVTQPERIPGYPAPLDVQHVRSLRSFLLAPPMLAPVIDDAEADRRAGLLPGHLRALASRSRRRSLLEVADRYHADRTAMVKDYRCCLTAGYRNRDRSLSRVTNEAAGAAKQIAQQLPGRLREHRLTLVSAGVAFYAFLAFVPTLIVIVTVYGLVAKPADIQRQVHDFAKALPDEVQKFIQQQITSIGHASGTRVSIALVIAVAIALWSASG